MFSDVKPLEYGPSQRGEAQVPLSNQSSIVQMLERKLKTIPIRELARQTGVDRNAIRRALRGERVHSKTRTKLLKAVAKFSPG